MPVVGTKSDDLNPIIIIGGGQAAVQCCIALRKVKVSTPILIFSEESELPYHRPPLSKSYLTGDTDEAKLMMRPDAFYQSKDIDVKLNATVTAINTEEQSVTSGNASYSYQSLVITTGSSPKLLPIPGIERNGVNTLRDLSHAKKIKKDLNDAKNITVVGAGFIGLEFAAVANALGKQVSVFDMGDRVMARAVSPAVSTWFDNTHRNLGVDIRLKESVSEIIGDTKVEQIKTTTGEVMPCDLLLLGVGVVPNDSVARDAGIHCDDGIVVNEYCETSAPNVYAAGDCAKHLNPFAVGPMIRLESIQNATDQARTIAKTIVGDKQAYHSVPWFWSDQGTHSLQMTGLSNAADSFVTRGSLNSDSFSVFHFLGNALQAVDSVNRTRDHMLARKLITAQVSPTFAQAADTEFDLKSILPS